MNKFILPILFVVLVILASCQSESAGTQDQATNALENTTNTSNESESVPEILLEESEYTLEDVALHNSESDCWSVINGNVYDLTDWINNHPGGASAIVSICGIDGSSAFNAQHGGNSKTEGILDGFFIGVLV